MISWNSNNKTTKHNRFSSVFFRQWDTHTGWRERDVVGPPRSRSFTACLSNYLSTSQHYWSYASTHNFSSVSRHRLDVQTDKKSTQKFNVIIFLLSRWATARTLWWQMTKFIEQSVYLAVREMCVEIWRFVPSLRADRQIFEGWWRFYLCFFAVTVLN